MRSGRASPQTIFAPPMAILAHHAQGGAGRRQSQYRRRPARVEPNGTNSGRGLYIIIYEPQPDGVMVVAIVHGMRNPESWLPQDPR